MTRGSKLEKFADRLDDDGRLWLESVKPGGVGLFLVWGALCGMIVLIVLIIHEALR